MSKDAQQITGSTPDPRALAALLCRVRSAVTEDFDEVTTGGDRAAHQRRLSTFSEEEVYRIPHIFESLRKPLRDLEHSGYLANPWKAAGLRRDEFRHASVLTWFLDPRGTHGCGGAVLIALLAKIRAHLPDEGFPHIPNGRCSLKAEDCPDGDSVNRVDIKIDDPAFFVIIEVKIGAAEQRDQLQRYCDLAANRAAGIKPWAVLFLTPDGRPPTTARPDQVGKILSLSWAQLADLLRHSVPRTHEIPRFLATSFADHIANL